MGLCRAKSNELLISLLEGEIICPSRFHGNFDAGSNARSLAHASPSPLTAPTNNGDDNDDFSSNNQ